MRTVNGLALGIVAGIVLIVLVKLALQVWQGKGVKHERRKLNLLILLSGYYGFGNVGDEAVLAAICDQLRQQLPGVRLAALTSNTSSTHRYQGIKGYDRWNRKTVKQAVRSCGMMVFGGGSLLQDVTSLKSLLYYVLQFYLAKRYRKPIMVYCQGLGPLRTGLGRRLAKWALNQADVIAWRDQGSLALAKEIGVTKEMQVFCDPVLAWAARSCCRTSRRPAGRKKSGFLFAPLGWYRT